MKVRLACRKNWNEGPLSVKYYLSAVNDNTFENLIRMQAALNAIYGTR
jgi:hypothetical protein